MTVVGGAEDSMNEPAEGGATALHYAVSGGHEECVRVLLQYGADINSITTTEEVRERERGVIGGKYHSEILMRVNNLYESVKTDLSKNLCTILFMRFNVPCIAMYGTIKK